MTLFLTTHYMEEAEESDRVGIIHKGKIISVDSPENMKEGIGEETIVLSTRDGNEKKVKALGFSVLRQGEKILLRVEKSEDALKKLLDGGINIENLTIKRPTLEDVFIKLTGTDIKDAPGDPMDVIKRANRIRRMNR